MNLVSLLILPAVITLRHHTGARYGIAGAALLILLAAILFSKRSTSMIADEESAPGVVLKGPGGQEPESPDHVDDAAVGS